MTAIHRRARLLCRTLLFYQRIAQKNNACHVTAFTGEHASCVALSFSVKELLQKIMPAT